LHVTPQGSPESPDPATQVGCPLAGVGHTLPQEPQLFGSVFKLVHKALQTVPAQLVPHVDGGADVSQMASNAVHAVLVVLHAPQLLGVLSAVSQPSVGSPLQSP
jgi:hypothetical protein